jgi:DNA-binding transcriptional LysR family regulator
MKDRLNGMRVFAQVVEAKSFSAAADKLGMSTSLASRHVSALERDLSVKLLHRTTRRLSLTEAGALFYEHCARIVQEAELAEQRLTQTQAEPAGLVRVTAVPAFAIRHVLPALAEFRQKYPKIQVKLFCSNRPVDLGEAGFDLGIRVSFDPAQNLVARKLAVNRAVLCASPEYLERHGVPRRIEDLRKHECVLFGPIAPKGVWTLKRGGRRYPVQVAGALETDEMDMVRAAVIAGLGISFLPAYMAGEDLRQGRLIPLLRQFQILPESAIYLVYLPNRTLSSRVRALIDFLADRFGPTPPWEEDLVR